MQPEQPNPNQPQSIQPAPVAQPIQLQTASLASDQTQKKIKNSGRSTFILGLFLSIIGALGLVASAFANPFELQDLVVSIIFLVLYLPLIVLGRGIKKAIGASEAKKKINIAIGLSVIAIIYNIVISILMNTSLSISGLLSIVLAIYLAVVSVRLKN